MFALLEKYEDAKKITDEHYFSCPKCQEYYRNIEAPRCQEYLKLRNSETEIGKQIEAYKIDIT